MRVEKLHLFPLLFMASPKKTKAECSSTPIFFAQPVCMFEMDNETTQLCR
jgi:hypothetical protein